jgi:hypothetical protein
MLVIVLYVVQHVEVFTPFVSIVKLLLVDTGTIMCRRTLACWLHQYGDRCRKGNTSTFDVEEYNLSDLSL